MNEHTALVHTGEPSRVDRTVSWMGWHLGELGGIGAPLVLAVTVSPWWAALSAVVAAGWIAHELHTHTGRAGSVARRAVQGHGQAQGQVPGTGRAGVEGVRRGELA